MWARADTRHSAANALGSEDPSGSVEQLRRQDDIDDPLWCLYVWVD